ncbi:MAG: hypothetical protein U0271_18940 [Polyangiaceae bacterium]
MSRGLELRVAHPSDGVDLLRIGAAELSIFLGALQAVLDSASAPPLPAWPPPEASAWAPGRADEVIEAFELEQRGYPTPYAPLEPHEVEAVRAYRRATSLALSAEPASGLVFAYKLTPASQQLLTPDECATLARALDGEPRWASYFSAASARGGCFVR